MGRGTREEVAGASIVITTWTARAKAQNVPRTGPVAGQAEVGQTGPCERCPVGPLDGSVPTRDLEPVAALLGEGQVDWVCASLPPGEGPAETLQG